jgi:hypothetical protein
MLLAEFAKIAGGWLWCNDTTEVGLGCLDRLVGKMRDKDIVGGGIDADAFLVGEGCQWHTTILLALCAPNWFVALEPVLAGWLLVFFSLLMTCGGGALGDDWL